MPDNILRPVNAYCSIHNRATDITGRSQDAKSQNNLARLPILVSSLAVAQNFYGSIVGIVTDPSNAPIEGATVALVNNGTGARQAIQSSGNGEYRFVNLVPGNYKLDIEKPGFKHYTRDRIAVEVEGAVRVDAALSVGDVTQSVEVSAATPLLQTENASLSQVVNSAEVQALPLNGRNVLNLAELVPGVVPQGLADGNPTGKNVFAAGNYQIGGGTANQSALLLRRRADEHHLRKYHGDESDAGRGGRVPRADQQQYGGVRALYGRRDQPDVKIGHELAARKRLRISAQPGAERGELLCELDRLGKSGVRAKPVWSERGRADLEEQDVLLWEL